VAPDLTALRLVLALLAVTVYAGVGYVVGKRQVSLSLVPANRAFQTWWYGLALISLFFPAMTLLTYAEAATGMDFFALRLFLFELILIGIVVAIGCLVYYLLYVYTGRTGVFWLVGVYHLLLLAWLLQIITLGRPFDYDPGNAACPSGWCYENDFAGTPTARMLSVGLLLPILLGAIAYFGLYFRVQEPEQKYRVAVVAGSLFLWFGTGLAASFIMGDFETAAGVVERVQLSQWVYWAQIVAPLNGLVASILIFLAYRPPRWVQQRLKPSAD
jgi:hypothetical protein